MPRHLIGDAHESAYEIFAGDTSVLETLNDTHIHNDIPVGSCLKILDLELYSCILISMS